MSTVTGIYWSIDGKECAAPSFPIAAEGVPFLFSMTLTNDTDATLTKAYLFTKDEFAGYARAKLSTESDYKEVRGIGNPECYLSYIPVGDTIINLEITLPVTGFIGYQVVPIILTHGDEVKPPCGLWDTSYDVPLWVVCYEQFPLWADSYPLVAQVCNAEDLSGGGGFVEAWDDGFVDAYTDGFEDTF